VYCHEVAIISNTLSSQTEWEYSLEAAGYRFALTGQAYGYQPCPALVCRLMVATLVIHVITWITTHLATLEG